MLLCNNMIFKNRKDAEEVLSSLINLISEYGRATVGDFYDLIGSTSTYGDFYDLIGSTSTYMETTYGWTDLSKSSVGSDQYGYHLCLPIPVKLQKEETSKTKHISIMCKTIQEAERVIDEISNLIRKYGSISVAEVSNAGGENPTILDKRYGWTSMRDIVLMEADDFEADTKKYQIVFPKPEDLVVKDKSDWVSQIAREFSFFTVNHLTDVIEQLSVHFRKNETLTITDFHKIVELEHEEIPEFSKYGWNKYTFKFKVSFVGGSYILKLPKIKEL